MSPSSLSSFRESATRTPPPASTPVKSTPAGTKSSPVGKVQPYLIQHKRDQVQAFDDSVQNLEHLTLEEFLDCLNVNAEDNLFLELPDLPHPSMTHFCELASDIAKFIKAKHFPNHDLLVFKERGEKAPNGHVTGTMCKPDITAAFEKDYVGKYADWALIRLAGEKASSGKSRATQTKQAATYLHYLLLARPDFLVAQGLLTTKSTVKFLVGIGGVGIKQLVVKWGDENLCKIMYASIYRLYEPSHFADPSYEMTGFDKKTSEAIYAVHFKMKEYLGFRSTHARNPFTTRTHVLSNLLLSQVEDGEDGPPTVFKEQLCRIGRRFDEWSILTRIHRPMNVPGVVEPVDREIIEVPLSPERRKYCLGLRQTGSPFTSIPTAKNMLETLFDLLEVLRCLYFKRRILHRDVSIGNVMYIENPENPQNAVEPLFFAKYLLGESDVPHKTSLLLVDFNLGEDLDDRRDGNRIERTGTPIFISRAVERGNPVPPILFRVPVVPKPPECYVNAHPNRVDRFPEKGKELVDPDNLENQSQDDNWRHELDHDVESVFWLLLYWSMVVQPEGQPGEYINSYTWAGLLGDFKNRGTLLFGLSAGNELDTLTHSVYQPLCPLIEDLANMLIVDRHWLPETSVRKKSGYLCEAFQRLILQFILSYRDEDFMTCRVGDSLRRVLSMAESQALSTTPSYLRDGSERENETKRLRLSSRTEDKDKDEDEDEDEESRMIL